MVGARDCCLARIDVLNQVSILLAERMAVLVNRCLVGVTESRVGQSLVIVDSTDSVRLVSRARGKSHASVTIPGPYFGVGALFEAVRNEVKVIAVSVNHARSLRNIVSGLVRQHCLDFARIRILGLTHAQEVARFRLQRRSHLFRNLLPICLQLSVCNGAISVKSLGFSD